MKTHLIEATNEKNYGKFLLGVFDSEHEREARVVLGPAGKLLANCGWRGPNYMLVTDVQTGEGAIFRLGGHVKHDLNKHKIWVCPMFEFFLEWLYAQYNEDPKKVMSLDLPELVNLDTNFFSFSGYRRPGIEPDSLEAACAYLDTIGWKPVAEGLELAVGDTLSEVIRTVAVKEGWDPGV